MNRVMSQCHHSRPAEDPHSFAKTRIEGLKLRRLHVFKFNVHSKLVYSHGLCNLNHLPRAHEIVLQRQIVEKTKLDYSFLQSSDLNERLKLRLVGWYPAVVCD